MNCVVRPDLELGQGKKSDVYLMPKRYCALFFFAIVSKGFALSYQNVGCCMSGGVLLALFL